MPLLARCLTAAASITAALALTATPALARTATVTSFDGTQIHVNFFPAAKLSSGAKAPTVLLGPGWGQPGVSDENGKTDPATGAVGPGPLRDAGYNFLTWDPRGFGQSTGTVEVDSPDFEARDVSALLDWLAQQPEVQLDGPGDPRAGMAGPSYGGGIQLATGPQDNRVDALVPSIA